MHAIPHLSPVAVAENRPGLSPTPWPDLTRAEPRTAGCLTAATAASVPVLRRFARGVAARWGLPAGIDDSLRLVVSELVGNAVRHSGGPDVALFLSVGHSTLAVEVKDNGRWRPHVGRPRHDDDLACGGRGLDIVAACALRCTVHTRPDGTRIVAELSLRD
ncbi:MULTISPECIES: ATP-binding protein [Streptomyces]|uniref:ATP-binding protein n=1 Tax=Streptomyces TaxID=1883 RepID=UPI000691D610|nr:MULTISPECIES: ATP-binding protein [Streptomyces]